MWNAVPDDLVDSSFVNAGVPAAGASGNIMTLYETVNAMDNNDTITGLDIQLTNANHTGANNFMHGLRIWGTIGDPQANEWAIEAGGAGWDASVFGNTTVLMLGSTLDIVSIVDYANYGAVFQFDTLAVAGASHTAAFFAPTLAIMNGADTSIGFYLSITTADHVGGPNTNNLYGINIEDIVNDDDTIEFAIVTETGWDVDIWNLDTDLLLGSTTQIVAVVDDTYGQIFTVDSAQAAGASNDWVTITANVAAMDGVGAGGDFTRGLYVDMGDANHTDAGTGSTMYGINIEGITADAQATEHAINIAAGWDEDISLQNAGFIRWNTALGQMEFDTTNGGHDIQFNFNGVAAFNMDGDGAAAAAATFEYNFVANFGSPRLQISNTDNTTMNGADTRTMLLIDLANAGDHTGVANVLYGLDIDAITGDAQARETAINVGLGWDVGVSSASHIFQRENFKQGFRKQLASDFSAATDTDTSVNIVIGTNGVNFEYREELAKTASSFILNNAGALDISADDTTDNEGVEIMLGSSQTTTSGYLIAQTDQLCFSVNATVALIAGTDQFVIGWRVNSAYDGANVYTNYSDYSVVGINNVDGSVFGLSDSTTGAAETDDSTTNWANTETRTLKACIDGAGLPHSYLDGTLVVETNRTTPIDANIMMVPFISYLQAGGAVDAAILINWWEITAN